MAKILVKKAWRTKTFTATGTAWFRSRFINGQNHLDGSGYECGQVQIVFPTANVGIGFAIDDFYRDVDNSCYDSNCPAEHYSYPATFNQDCHLDPYPHCPHSPEYQACGQTTLLNVSWNMSGPGYGGYAHIPVEYDSNLMLAIESIQPCLHDGQSAFTQEYNISATATIEITYQTDLYCELLGTTETERSGCYPEAGHLPELYCSRLSDRSGSYLLDTIAKWTENFHDRGDGMANITATITVDVAGLHHVSDASYELSASTEDTENVIDIDMSAIHGNWGIDGIGEDAPAATATFTRSFSDAPSYSSYNAVYQSEVGYDPTRQLKVTLEGNQMSLFATQGHLTTPGGGYVATFRDFVGAWSTPYTGSIVNMDGSTVTGVQLMSRINSKPVFHPAAYPSYGYWDWSTPLTFSPGDTIEWKGWWRLTSPACGTMATPGGDYVTQDGIAEFMDMPADPRPHPGEEGLVGTIRQGMINIANIGSLHEPYFDTLHAPAGSLEFHSYDNPPEIPDYADLRVILTPAHALDVLHWNAGQISIGLAAGETSAAIFSFGTTGWTKSRVPLTITGHSGYPAVTNPIIGDWIKQDFTSLNKRLTGTRYAKIDWWSDGAAIVKLWISGYWWLLSATTSGDHTDIIDLCRPNCTLSAGGTGNSLQYRSSDGALMHDNTTGNLVHDCCCNSCSCDAPIQRDSIIPTELPEHLWTTSHAPKTHGTDLGRGWGIGRVGEVKIEYRTADTDVAIKTIKLYRKPTNEGGFAKIWLSPQASFNLNRSTGDAAVFYAGRRSTMADTTEYWWDIYRYRAGVLVVDGAVVGEIPIGGFTVDGDAPNQITGGYVWEWLPLNTGVFPCYPYDNYENPTGLAANGVVSISRLEPPKINNVLAVPGCYAPQLDPLYGSNLTNGQNLTATLRFDMVETKAGFGNVIGGIDKQMRGLVTGLAYNGCNPYQGTVRITEDGGGIQDVQTNDIGWYTAKTRGTGDAVVDITTGTKPSVTVHARNRHETRAVVEK